MSEPNSPYESEPPSSKRVLATTLVAIAGAAMALVAFVLPAEYGIDPTGLGNALGLTAMGEPVRTFEVRDVIGGNEAYREVEVPDFGEPVPLPNPDVHYDAAEPYQTRTLKITIPPEQETEIKTVLDLGSMIVYAWKTDRGDIYSDFHGHDPAAGDEYWVRYEEHQEGAGDSGALAAPFAGEHGWYWLNYNDHPIVVTLTVVGYYNDIIDYGVL